MMTDTTNTALPQKVRVTLMRWSEKSGIWKAQIGDETVTVAYAYSPGGSGDITARDKCLAIATRICEGWNSHD